MNKLVKMLNFSSSKLDEILTTGRMNKEYIDLGYTSSENTTTTQTVLVKADTSSVKKNEDVKLKASVATPTRSSYDTQKKTYCNIRQNDSL